MKKFALIFLAVILAVLLVACSGDKETKETESTNKSGQIKEDGVSYSYRELSSNTVSITGYKGPYEAHAVTIPETLDGKIVIAIDAEAFKDNNYITSVSLPSALTEIGEYAFANCDYLTEVHLSQRLAVIGEGAFYSSALKQVTFPISLETIGKASFGDCANLTSVTFEGTSLTTFGEAAFRSCPELTAISIPEGTLTIGKQAFYNCGKLSSVTIPDSVTTIGRYAFTKTAAAEAGTIVYPEGVTETTD